MFSNGLSVALWSVTLWPLACALVGLFRPAWFGRAVRVCASSALAVALLLAWATRGGQVIESQTVSWIRLGQLDLVLGLSCRGPQAMLAVALAVMTLATVRDDRVWSSRDACSRGLMTAAAWVAVFAGSFWLLAWAWGLFCVSLLLPFLPVEPFAWARWAFGALSVALVLMASFVVFWANGGSWSQGEYWPDLAPRVAALAGKRCEAPMAVDPAATGFISLRAYPGALVYLDGARLPVIDGEGRALRAPFACFPVALGKHAVRISPGAGTEDILVGQVDVPAAAQHPGGLDLALVGPTIDFERLRDQWTLPAPEGKGTALFAGRAPFWRLAATIALAAVACFLVFAMAVDGRGFTRGAAVVAATALVIRVPSAFAHGGWLIVAACLGAWMGFAAMAKMNVEARRTPVLICMMHLCLSLSAWTHLPEGAAGACLAFGYLGIFLGSGAASRSIRAAALGSLVAIWVGFTWLMRLTHPGWAITWLLLSVLGVFAWRGALGIGPAPKGLVSLFAEALAQARPRAARGVAVAVRTIAERTLEFDEWIVGGLWRFAGFLGSSLACLVHLADKRMRGMFAWPFLVVVLLASGYARAETPAGRIQVSDMAEPGTDGRSGVVVLRPKDGGYQGSFVIRNVGSATLNVSRLSVRTDDDDVRAPSKLTIRFADGRSFVDLKPNEQREALVQWLPDKGNRLRHIFAHVVVTSNDDRYGEIALGVRAHTTDTAWLTQHAISFLLMIPLAALFLAFVMKRSTHVGRIVSGALGLECVVALWMLATFEVDLTRLDGQDGYQFIERAIWVRPLGVEYFVGVNGISLFAIVLVCLVAVAGAWFTSIDVRPVGYHAGVLLAVMATVGALASLDLSLLFVCLFVALGALAYLFRVFGPGARGARAVSVACGGSLALFALAFLLLHRHSVTSLLVDGSRVSRSWALPELARLALHAEGSTLFGIPLSVLLCALIGLAVAPLLAAFPFHGWFVSAWSEAPAALRPMVALFPGLLGFHVLVHVLYGTLPEPARLVAGAMLALGVTTAGFGALCALASPDLLQATAYLLVSQSGLVLMGLASLTPQGIAGAVLLLGGRLAAGTPLGLLLQVWIERAKTSKLARVPSGPHMPGFSLAVGLALGALFAVPGAVTFWGTALVLVGSFPSYPGWTALGLLVLVMSAAAHMRIWVRLRVAHGRTSPISVRIWSSVLPLLALAYLAGLWPRAILSTIGAAVRDVSNLVNPPGPDQIS